MASTASSPRTRPSAHLLIDPADTNVLYLATSGFGIFKSADGATWAAFNDGLTSLDVRSLAIVRGTVSTVYTGTSDGVFKIVEGTESGNTDSQAWARREGVMGTEPRAQ